jgi:hypothetical protein
VLPVGTVANVKLNPKVVENETGAEAMNATYPSVCRFVPPIDAGARNFELAALTPAGSVVSNVNVPVVADVAAANVTDPLGAFGSAGSASVDAVVAYETDSEALVCTVGCGVVLVLPPPPHPAKRRTADAKMRRLFNVRSRLNPIKYSVAAHSKRACAVPGYVTTELSFPTEKIKKPAGPELEREVIPGPRVVEKPVRFP